MNSSVFSWRRNAKYVDDVLTDEGNNNNIIIIIITDLYSAFRSEDTEALGAAQED